VTLPDLFAASTPAVAYGVVYLGCYDHKFYALDAATGETLWTFQTGFKIGCPPAVVDGVVYCGSGDGKLYALHAATGREQWSFQTGGNVFAVTVADGRVYASSGDETLYALEARRGRLLWSLPFTFPELAGFCTVHEGRLYLAAGTSIRALEAATGRAIWTYTEENLDSPLYQSPPVIAYGKVYAATLGENEQGPLGMFVALDAQTGAKVWEFGPLQQWIKDSGVVVNGVVYFGSHDDHLYAVDAETGQELWRYDVQGWPGESSAFAGGILYVAAAGGVYAFGP